MEQHEHESPSTFQSMATLALSTTHTSHLKSQYPSPKHILRSISRELIKRVIEGNVTSKLFDLRRVSATHLFGEKKYEHFSARFASHTSMRHHQGSKINEAADVHKMKEAEKNQAAGSEQRRSEPPQHNNNKKTNARERR
jgi:hypothetical protein